MEEFNELISRWRLGEGESQEEMSWKISEDDMKTHKDKVISSDSLIDNAKMRNEKVIHSGSAYHHMLICASVVASIANKPQNDVREKFWI